MSMTGITNPNIIPKNKYTVSRSTTPRSASRPFVVCSMSTKRYAVANIGKTPTQRPALAPDPGEPRSKSKTSALFSRLTKKTIGSAQSKVAKERKEVIATYGHLTTADDPFQRPSCVPRGRLSQSSVSATLVSRGKQEVVANDAIPRSRNPKIKAPVDVPTTRTRAHGTGAGPTVEKPSVSEHRPGLPSSGNERLALYAPVIYPDVNWSPPPSPDLSSFPSQSWTIEKPSVSESHPEAQNDKLALYTPVIYPDVNWSPPPSPDLSSFPSQSWTIAVCVDVKQAMTTVCGEEISPSTRETEESGSPDMPDDFRGSFESDSTSPASSTVVSTPPSSDAYTSGMDGTLDAGSLRKGPYVEISPTECAAKIISRSKTGSTSADTLTRILERHQADSPTRNTDAGSTARGVRSVMEIARNLFSHSERLSQVTPQTSGITITSTNVSRARKLLVPPLEDTRPSSNPMIQMEIDMLRTWKKVAGGGVVNSRLERLGSLSAIAIATKLGISGPDRV